MTLPVPNYPIENAGALHINGCNVSFLTGTTLSLSAGQARDSQNINDISLAAAVTINAATVGANGLDTGALANSTLYAVWLIGDSTKYNDAAGLLSTSFTSPSLPAGYDMARRVGAVLTSGAAAILEFSQRGDGADRHMYYEVAVATDIAIAVGGGGGGTAVAAAPGAVDCSDSIPSTASMVHALCLLTADGAGLRSASLRDGTITGAGNPQAIMSAATSLVNNSVLTVPCSNNPTTAIDYFTSNANAGLTISVIGYVDVV